MSTARVLHRSVRFALQNVRRNIWLAVATVLVFVLMLLTVNILVGIHVLAQAAIASVEERIDVSVHFRKGTSEALVFAARDYLAGLSQVKSVEYVSAEEALTRFTERRSANKDILHALDTVGSNPLGPELIITARTPEDFAFILEALANPTFGDAIEKKNFSDHEEMIGLIESLTRKVRLFVVGLAGVFAVIAILIVLNSIRVSVYTHREEIGIMRLVGADNHFIRLPFALEGVIFSVVATIIAAAIVLPATAAVQPALTTFFEGATVGLNEYYLANWYWLFGLQAVGLSLLAVLASALAMGRYLKI